MMALLIDPDGYVLSLSGNKQTLQRAKQINFIEGVNGRKLLLVQMR